MARVEFASGVAAFVLAIVAAFALWEAAAAKPVSASQRNASSATDIPGDVADAANASASRNGKCDIRIDISDSIDDKTRKSSLDDLSVMLDRIVHRFNCRTLRLSAFTASAFPIAMAAFDLPAVPKPARCAIPPKQDPMCRVYPASCHAPQDEVDRCNKGNTDLMSTWHAKKDDAMALARQRLRSFNDVTPAGDCTAVYENAAYGLIQAQYVIVVTDAESNCPWPEGPYGEAKTVSVGPQAKLVFLLVRGKNDPSGVNALAYSIKAQRVFPKSVAVPFEDAIAPSFWNDMR